MRRLPHFSELVGAVLSAVAVGAVAYLAIGGGSEQAQGALIALVSAATSFWLRGKVERAATA